MIGPFSPGFDLERYDRELRRPIPSVPQFANDSKVWRREHAIGNSAEATPPSRQNAPIIATSHAQRMEF
jgi:hypothetical protein